MKKFLMNSIEENRYAMFGPLQRNKTLRFMSVGSLVCSLSLAVFLPTSVSEAGWKDFLKDATESVKEKVGNVSGGDGISSGGLSALTQGDASKGLREALLKGIDRVVGQLGGKDGFLSNPKVRIPLPDSLQTVDKALRKLGQEKYADQFVESMNRAAESAVKQAAPIFSKAITDMSFDDAKAILTGGDDAATQYLRKATDGDLRKRMIPIVKQATERAQVTSAYKKLKDKGGRYLGMAQKFLGEKKDLDVDSHITNKALEGLYATLAEQEKQIRKNPAEWTSSALKKVFSAL